MKIAWLHSHLLNPNSGGTRYITDFITGLKKLGVEVDLYCDQISDQSRSYFKEKNIKVTIIDKLSTWSAIYWLTLPLRIINKRSFFNSLKSEYDVFITSMFPMNLVPQALNVKCVQICFEPYAFFYDSKYITKFKITVQLFFKLMSILYSNQDRIFTSKSKLIITVSESSKKKIKNVYKMNSKIIRASVDSSRKKNVQKKSINEFRNKFNGSPLLLHTTDYTGNKATNFVVEIVSKLKKYFPKIKLLLVYYINDQKVFIDIKNKYKNNSSIIVLNAFPHEQMPLVYTSVDYVIQPNIDRGESWPLREAILFKTPIIGGMLCEECFSEQFSIKINPIDLDSSVNRVKDFINRKRYEFSFNSIEKYSLDLNTKKLLKYISKI